ncbi:MAG TPA: hypothetical protein VF252_11305 [Gemmatimonadales bacterium]
MRRTALLIAAIALPGGCSDPPTADKTPDGLDHRGAPAAEQQGLSAIRAATARFHRFDVAYQEGYDFLFLNTCMVDQSGANRGGMGYHYVDPGLLDGQVSLATPEAVLYEPGPNGQLRLVALEYVIPKSAWTQPDPPVLLGQEFALNAFDLWALHVWAWKQNPSGIYSEWNPDVDCDNAAAVSAGAHH